MSLYELFIIAVALSMDAFAVSICTGLSMRKDGIKEALTAGLYFGVFQAAMPLIGYLVGSQFADKISSVDHWIVFALLFMIGGKMLLDSFSKDDMEINDVSLTPAKMLPLALATSVDALAVGISFAFLNVNIVPAVSFIGIVTFALSTAGVKIGRVLGLKFKSKAEFAGGIILILMGLKVLLEHLGVLSL